jgi:hypothetical protein
VTCTRAIAYFDTWVNRLPFGLCKWRCCIAAFDRATSELCCYKLSMLTAAFIMAGHVADCTVMLKCAHSEMLISTAVVDNGNVGMAASVHVSHFV